MSLRYVPLEECRRVAGLDVDPVDRAAAFADVCRLNALYMIERAGSGHPGTTFSCLDIVSWLHLEVLGPDDRYFSSKGHDAPGLYAVLTALGKLDFDLIHQLRRLDGLPGHPDVHATPEVVTSTGSLGMGVSKARGFVLADRAQGRSGHVYVLTGDGELQEGQFWESLQQTANRGLGEITVIVDHNKVQSDTWVSQVNDLRRPRREDRHVRLGGGALQRERSARVLRDARVAPRREAPAGDRCRHAQGRRRLVHGAVGAAPHRHRAVRLPLGRRRRGRVRAGGRRAGDPPERAAGRRSAHRRSRW